VLLLAAVLVLHYIPIRVLLLAWGIIKFSKRLVRPHTVSNNEVLDLLSRVPDDEELVSFLNPFLYQITHKNNFQTTANVPRVGFATTTRTDPPKPKKEKTNIIEVS
jgi:hypothetical protein